MCKKTNCAANFKNPTLLRVIKQLTTLCGQVNGSKLYKDILLANKVLLQVNKPKLKFKVLPLTDKISLPVALYQSVRMKK